MARSPPAQLPGHVLKCSPRQALLGRLHRSFQRLDLILVRVEEILDVDFSIGVGVPRGRGGDVARRLHGKARPFGLRRSF